MAVNAAHSLAAVSPEQFKSTFAGKDGGRSKQAAEYCLTVPSFSIHRIQEVHTTLLHVLWDMTHVLRGEEDII